MLSYEIFSGYSGGGYACMPDCNPRCEPNEPDCGPDYGADCMPECDPEENGLGCAPWE